MFLRWSHAENKIQRNLLRYTSSLIVHEYFIEWLVQNEPNYTNSICVFRMLYALSSAWIAILCAILVRIYLSSLKLVNYLNSQLTHSSMLLINNSYQKLPTTTYDSQYRLSYCLVVLVVLCVVHIFLCVVLFVVYRITLLTTITFFYIINAGMSYHTHSIVPRL